MPKGPQTDARRAVVREVISEGRWSSSEAARIAHEFGCSTRTVENDRRRIAGTAQGRIPKSRKKASLHALPSPKAPAPNAAPTESMGVLLSKCSRVEAFEWLLDCVGDAVKNGDPASGAFVAGVKECRALINELHTVREAEKANQSVGTPATLATEMGEKLKRLPAPMRKKLAAALAAG